MFVDSEHVIKIYIKKDIYTYKEKCLSFRTNNKKKMKDTNQYESMCFLPSFQNTLDIWRKNLLYEYLLINNTTSPMNISMCKIIEVILAEMLTG